MNANKKISTLIISSILVLNAGSLGIASNSFISSAENSITSNENIAKESEIIQLNESTYEKGGVAALKNGDIYTITVKDKNSTDEQRKIHTERFQNFMSNHNESQYTIKVTENVLFPDDSKKLFMFFKGEIEISDNVDTSNVKNMSEMFSYLDKANPNTKNWNTSNVTDMSNMFSVSPNANPDTNDWNISKVTNMEGMFSETKKANPDTKNWDTSNLNDVSYMFADAAYANPNTTNWDTSNITSMDYMFFNAPEANPDVSKWDTSSVTTMYSLFGGALKANPNTTNWDTSNVTDMSYMFSGAKSANPDVSKWDTSKVTTMEALFDQAVKADPDVSKWDTSNVTDMSALFHYAEKSNPDVSKWDTSKVTTMSNMFRKTIVANPDVSKWDTSSVTDMSAMFSDTTIADPDVSKWDTSNVSNLGTMFSDSKKANPDISNWDISKATDISLMFYNAKNANPNVSKWDTSKVDYYYNIFESTGFKSLDTRTFIFSDKSYELNSKFELSPTIKNNKKFEKLLFNYNPNIDKYIPLETIYLTKGDYTLNRITDNNKYNSNNSEGKREIKKFKVTDESKSLEDLLKTDLDKEREAHSLDLDHFEITKKKINTDTGGGSSGGGGSDSSSKNCVILASGDKYTDVLTATVLGNEKKCPILLTEKNKISDNTLNEIKRLKASKIIISGGPESVSNSVVSQLEKDDYDIRRIAGQNRYETAKKIGEEVRLTTKNTNEAILVDGTNFPDVITISALANQKRAPILLTEPQSLNKTTENVLKDWKIDNVTIGGEKKSVSQEAENKVKTTAKTVNRIGGHDRYETAYKVAHEVRNTTNNKKDMILVDGTNFPDGITISSLSAKFKSPILLTTPNNLHPTTAKALNDWTIENILIGGGYKSVSKTIEDSLDIKNKERIAGSNRYNTAIEISQRYTNTNLLGRK
ncbi:MAG: BspA family leucine-rich repeat surface protein [Peptostreptococcus sp.]|uniref:BspA family leucine-rich repeat surface protein n=1 Tax=Peptostreptococcus sp. TaxID=1262 RepID=UPI002FC70BFA